LNLKKIEIECHDSYVILRIINLVTLLGNYSFRNIKCVETTVEGNKKGDVLKIQLQDSGLYESGDSECISPNAEAEISL
jgi:hypothetical protein